MNGRRTHGIPWMALAALVSCKDHAPQERTIHFETEQRWDSEHFVYHSHPSDDSVCRGVTETLEHHFSVMRDYLGFAWPVGRRIDYYKFQDAKDLRAHGSCSDFNAECFYAEVGVQSAEGISLHELVHAYLSALGRRHTLLEEGLAESLSCAHHVRPRPEPVDVVNAFAPESWSSNTVPGYKGLYSAARWFVGWLLKAHGPKQFMRFYEHVSATADFAATSNAFREVYGAELKTTWDSALASPDMDVACVRIWECAQPQLSSSPLAANCEQVPAIRTFNLEGPQWVVQSGGSGALMESCGDTPRVPHEHWLSPSFDGEQGDVFALLLGPGRYFISQSPRFGAVSLELFNYPPAANSVSCSALVPLRLNFTRNVSFAVQGSAARSVASAATSEVSQRAPGVDLLIPWMDTNAEARKITRAYAVQCSESSRSSDIEAESTPTRTGSIGFETCQSCEKCSAACDTNVAPFDVLGTAAQRLLRWRITPNDPVSASGDVWVRLSRTY